MSAKTKKKFNWCLVTPIGDPGGPRQWAAPQMVVAYGLRTTISTGFEGRLFPAASVPRTEKARNPMAKSLAVNCVGIKRSLV